MGLIRPLRQKTRTAPCILVVDDDASLRAVVRVALSAEGWEVLEASGPDEGLARARAARPDVVLLDVVFPGEARDGFALCRELRALRATRHIPIVLFTAYDDGESRAFAAAVGATSYIVKPFGPIDLLRMLRLVQGPTDGQPGLGLYLVDAGALTPEQLEHALAEQYRRGGPRAPLGEILVELGFATAETIQLALERQQRARERTPAAAPSPIDLRVVIADDHASVRDGLRAAVVAEDGLTVVGMATDGEEALRQIRTLRPDLVVLDNDMPRLRGLDVLRAVHAELPDVAVIMFTLDDGLRAAALSAGAAAVVTKDSPLRVLIAELRRAASARRGDRRGSPAVVLAARGAARRAWGVLVRRQRGIAAMGVLAVAYTGTFLTFEPVLGASAAIFQLIPVALAGALLGPEIGVVAALLAALLTMVLWQGTGHPIGEPILTIGGNGLGVLAMMGLGAGFGLMRVLRGRISSDARRASALAEAALLLAGNGGGTRMVQLLARGALDIAPGDAVLLFLPVPGGGLELIAAVGAPADLLGSRQTGDAVTRAHLRGRAAITDAGAASIGVEVGRMRSALVVPLSAAGPAHTGVLAVLSGRRDGFHESHLQALRAYGAFVGTALGSRAQTGDAREPAAAGETSPAP